jgi:LmbE family N-acetylglucosaminyl deacetylase
MSDLLLRHVGTPPAAQRVLVIGAHPDDPEFFCAGTIARWIAAGTIVHYVVVTSGDKGIPEDWTDPRPFVTVREKEQLAAAEELGVQGVTFLRLPDGEVFDTLDLRAQLTAEIRRFRPDIVLTHDPLTRLYRQHPDHRPVGAAALAAAFPASRVATFFPEQREARLEPHTVRVALLFGTDRPDTFIDIAPASTSHPFSNGSSLRSAVMPVKPAHSREGWRPGYGCAPARQAHQRGWNSPKHSCGSTSSERAATVRRNSRGPDPIPHARDHLLDEVASLGQIIAGYRPKDERVHTEFSATRYGVCPGIS